MRVHKARHTQAHTLNLNFALRAGWHSANRQGIGTNWLPVHPLSSSILRQLAGQLWELSSEMLSLVPNKWICQHSSMLIACTYFVISFSATYKCLRPLLIVPAVDMHGSAVLCHLQSKVYKAQHRFIGKERPKRSSVLASVTVYFCSSSKYWPQLNENQTLHTEHMGNKNWEHTTGKGH